MRDSELDEDELIAKVHIFALAPRWLVLLAISILFVTFILAIRGRQDPVYTISPSDCQEPSLYSNASSWYLGEWYILYGRGACPVGASGMKTVYIKQGSDVTTQTFWTYNSCINNATQWSAVDERNRQHGYESHLSVDEWRWTTAMALSVGAIMTLFFCGFLLFLMLSGFASGRDSRSGEVSVAGLSTAAALLALFLLQEVAVVVLISHTARIDPRAWSTAYFASCSVSVQRNTGFLFPLVCACLSGTVLLFAATAACLHAYRTGGRLSLSRSERTSGNRHSSSSVKMRPQTGADNNSALGSQMLRTATTASAEADPYLQKQ